ncbi:MAG: hypothetical protein Ct9H300mP28_35260 [Pseudomonadota bacterium]|nr:MAG: hypothetical protein Ct9H300mP28_35260 [Pseudomonadota bacterium]
MDKEIQTARGLKEKQVEEEKKDVLESNVLSSGFKIWRENEY